MKKAVVLLLLPVAAFWSTTAFTYLFFGIRDALRNRET